VVLTRNRLFIRNIWPLPNPTGPAWYLLQTNYDHWLPDPVHDARRTYGDAHMTALGQAAGATLDGVFSVLSTWRTFRTPALPHIAVYFLSYRPLLAAAVMNNFTGQSVMMSAKTGVFHTYIRYFY
jgi:hypothetical protein